MLSPYRYCREGAFPCMSGVLDAWLGAGGTMRQDERICDVAAEEAPLPWKRQISSPGGPINEHFRDGWSLAARAF